MGQAKRRGAREERIQQSIERQAQESAKLLLRDQEKWAALTPAERSAYRARQEKARSALRLVGGIGGLLGSHTYYPHP